MRCVQTKCIRALASFVLVLAPIGVAADDAAGEPGDLVVPLDQDTNDLLREVTEGLDENDAKLRRSFEALALAFERSVARQTGPHEPPDFPEEIKRSQVLRAMLQLASQDASRILADADRLRAAFDEWKTDYRDAAPVYRRAVAELERKVADARFEEEATFYGAFLRMYEYKHARSVLFSSQDLPVTFDVEIERVSAMKEALDFCHQLLEDDHSDLDEGERSTLDVIATFKVRFEAIGAHVNRYADILGAGLEPVETPGQVDEPSRELTLPEQVFPSSSDGDDAPVTWSIFERSPGSDAGAAPAAEADGTARIVLTSADARDAGSLVLDPAPGSVAPGRRPGPRGDSRLPVVLLAIAGVAASTVAAAFVLSGRDG